MSKLGKFLGHAEEITVQGETLKIYPLCVKDLKLFMGAENATTEEQMELSKVLIKESLKDEDISDGEIEAMNTEAFIEIMDAINKINGFKDDKLDRIKQLKKQTVQ